MATRRFEINRGETFYNITENVGAATAVKNLEVTVDLASNMTKSEVLAALDMLSDYINSMSQYPPQ